MKATERGIAAALSPLVHDRPFIVGAMTTPSNDRLPPASAAAPSVPLEVRTRFEGRWGSGFELAEIVDTGAGVRFRVRRASGEVLPVLFGPEDVRIPNATFASALLRVPVVSDS